MNPIHDDILQSLKDFDKISLPNFNDLRNVFTHNDLGVQNLIINDQNEL
jgi:thiamine kinase-like enzyme